MFRQIPMVAWGACSFQDVRADCLSDASTTMPNRWCRKRGERRKARVTSAKTGERSTAIVQKTSMAMCKCRKTAPRIKISNYIHGEMVQLLDLETAQ